MERLFCKSLHMNLQVVHDPPYHTSGRGFSIKQAKGFNDQNNHVQEIFRTCPRNPSERMNLRTDVAFAYAVGDLLLRSLMSIDHSSSMIILSKALRTWRSQSIMMKFVAKRVSIGKRMDKLEDNLWNMACEAWWLLMKTEMILAFFTNFFTHSSLPQSSRRRSKQCVAHPCTYRWEMD